MYSIEGNKAIMAAIDRERAGIHGTSGLLLGGGPPLCSHCQPWLGKLTTEEMDKYEQMMRDGIDITDFINQMKEKYS